MKNIITFIILFIALMIFSACSCNAQELAIGAETTATADGTVDGITSVPGVGTEPPPQWWLDLRARLAANLQTRYERVIVVPKPPEVFLDKGYWETTELEPVYVPASVKRLYVGVTETGAAKWSEIYVREHNTVVIEYRWVFNETP